MIDNNNEDDDNELCLGAIGFMFDAQHARCTKHLYFDENIHLEIRLIGEDPGHVQSGQYLWPAAAFTAKYLIQHWNTLQATTVIELGAGVGVAGLVASKLSGCRKVVLTDYDPGAIQLLQENVALNDTNRSRALSEQNVIHQSSSSTSSSSSAFSREESFNVSVSFLCWGSDISDLYGLLGIDCSVIDSTTSSSSSSSSSSDNACVSEDAISRGSDNHDQALTTSSSSSSSSSSIPLITTPSVIIPSDESLFSLVLGTDLLYSIDIVSPLFKSAKMLMARKGRFLLISSFFPGQVCYSVYPMTPSAVVLFWLRIKPIFFLSFDNL